MGFIVGIDAGSSATKIIGMNTEKHLYLAPWRTDKASGADFFHAAISKYLSRSGIMWDELTDIYITGGRAEGIENEIDGVPVTRVSEFDAMAAGALEFTGKEKGLIANIGTGTCFVYAEKGAGARHIGGSGIGGGTLVGLCSRLAYIDRIDDITSMAETGDLSNIDISVADMELSDLKTLDPNMTLSNFGKLGDAATTADMVLASINLVLQSVGTLSLFALNGFDCDTVILTGALTELPQAKPIFENFEAIYGKHFIRCGLPAFVTAAGTMLCAK